MWEELYEELYPQLLKFAVGACRDREAAEDLAQEAFVKALQNPDLLEDLGPSQRRAWLFRTVKNLLVDRCRRARVEAGYAEAIQGEAVAAEPGYQTAENALVLAALSSLDRLLFQLRYLEGYDASELSRMLGLPAGIIRARLSRSRKLLKTILNDD